MSTPYEFDTADGTWPALAQIDSDRFLCSYTGTGSDGWAVVLDVNTSAWTISKETPYEFDISNGQYPALVKIYDGSCADDWRHLCAYTGPGTDGWSVVLNYTELKP
jgi:carbohydrate-binding DOMON domain-containing protein